MNSIFRLIMLGLFGFTNLGSQEITRYINGRVLKDHELKKEDFFVKDGKVVDCQTKVDKTVDVQGLIIAPGYIDLQINGGFGVDFSKNPESILHVAKKLTEHGVTSFLPTLISLEEHAYKTFIPIIEQKAKKRDGANILGVHLEGPFFDLSKKGAHDENSILSYLTIDLLHQTYGDLSFVKMITLAPELEGAIDVIGYLRENNIVVSAGHTKASYDEMMLAKNAGATAATHLFNAMPPLNHREPGCIGAVLTNNLYYSLIVDGIHVDPNVVNMAFRSNRDGLFLVTDAMQALGQEDGIYHLGQMEVMVDNGRAYLSGTKTLAGSVLRMDLAVKNFRQFTGCSLVEAIDSASYKPAKLLNLKTKGNLNVGSDADFIFLDDELSVKACFVSGKKQ